MVAAARDVRGARPDLFPLNDLELTWDRPFEAWPRDALGHLQGLFDDLDLDALAAAG